MDIEPLWFLGGWIFLSNCMAEPNTSKQLNFFHFLTLFLILLLIINLSHQPTSTINPSPTTSTKSTMSPSSTSTNLHPHKPQKHGDGKEFGVDAHEVPSGPNPISNR
ncbi:unnamed protein product [Lathyrus sativus]|nr:unnamed protein product [Lathyrus sativus]